MLIDCRVGKGMEAFEIFESLIDAGDIDLEFAG